MTKKKKKLIMWTENDIGIDIDIGRDLNKVHDGMGTKIGMFFANITTVIVGFIMGFVYGWKLTLVIIAVSPLIVIAGGIIGKVTC